MMLARLVVFALLFALGCGKSQQERALDEIGRRCESFVGIRLGDADRELLRDGPYDLLSPGCDPRLASIGGSTCTESTQENAQCQIFYYWYAGADPGLCSPIGGCFFKCELRFMQNDPDAVASGNVEDSKICASRWLEGQLYPKRLEDDLKAIAIRAHGGPEAVNLVELPDPTPGPGQVVVAVKAAAQNHLDIWVRIGWPGLKLAFPHVLGSDVAGVVEAIGPGVEGMKVGDAVVVNPSLGCGRCERCLSGNENLCRRFAILGEHVSGVMAEKLAVPARNVLPKPENLSFVEAAAVPLTFMTAWHALVARAQVRLGETVLVHAAGSGVGVAAVQIAKLLGARVIATAGSDEKLRRAKELGADEVVNYESQDFVQEVRRLTDKRGVEVVFEHVGKKTWEKSILSAGIGGRIVTVGATTGYDPLTDLRHVFFRQLSILGSTMGTAADLVQVLRYVGEGKLRPVVDRTMPLADAVKGHALLSERAQFGKIVLEP